MHIIIKANLCFCVGVCTVYVRVRVWHCVYMRADSLEFMQTVFTFHLM